MYGRPEHLPDHMVAGALTASWDLGTVTLEYQPVGCGSYHWRAASRDGTSWFVTVDDLAGRLRSADDSQEAAFQRLRAALVTARAVKDTGASFVAAPTPTVDGEIAGRIGDRFAIALYPFVAGRPFDFGDRLAAADRAAVLQLLVALHATPERVRGTALTEDFLPPGRAGLTGILAGLTAPWDGGPYGERARALIGQHASAVERLLGQYDELAARAREQAERRVLTHGEPHPGNLIQTGAGWLLIDWDTTLLALPERDLWLLDPGDGSVTSAYQQATGRDVQPGPAVAVPAEVGALGRRRLHRAVRGGTRRQRGRPDRLAWSHRVPARYAGDERRDFSGPAAVARNRLRKERQPYKRLTVGSHVTTRRHGAGES
jgi:spectinomycin phosphotransferase/16S rRNA (guanine(1405)-N(7))-methyltransferase